MRDAVGVQVTAGCCNSWGHSDRMLLAAPVGGSSTQLLLIIIVSYAACALQCALQTMRHWSLVSKCLAHQVNRTCPAMVSLSLPLQDDFWAEMAASE